MVIANAGISYIWPTIKDAKIEDIDAHMRTNVYGVVSLYQATRDLLQKTVELGREPVFVLMGSAAGYLAYVFLFSFLSYTYPLFTSP